MCVHRPTDLCDVADTVEYVHHGCVIILSLRTFHVVLLLLHYRANDAVLVLAPRFRLGGPCGDDR